MFENKTFENLLRNTLNYVNSKDPDIDTRDGSMIYMADAPVAMEMETIYRGMDMVLKETFVSTASKQYLVEHGKQLGVELIEATYGHYEGKFNVDVEIGSRFSLDDFNYSVIAKIAKPTEENPYYICELVCETAGSEPNTHLGDLIPITFVNNLSYAKLTRVLLYGEDEESTESYRYRIQVHTNNPPIDGNISQYSEWLSEYDGVGQYRIIPCWNGSNTVKLMVLNPENRRASDVLIASVQNYIDPPTSTINDDIAVADYPQGRGMGNGKAPIGAIVTVDSAVEIPVKVECQVTLKDGYNAPTGVQDAVNNYLKSIVLNKTVVDYMAISAEIYNTPCVDGVISLKITVNDTVMDKNSTPFISSVTIGDSAIAVLDTENSVWGVQ